jgi:hypothetical protein
MNSVALKQSLLEKLTQTVYLDRVLKILGVAGFIVTYLLLIRLFQQAPIGWGQPSAGGLERSAAPRMCS